MSVVLQLENEDFKGTLPLDVALRKFVKKIENDCECYAVSPLRRVELDSGEKFDGEKLVVVILKARVFSGFGADIYVVLKDVEKSKQVLAGKERVSDKNVLKSVLSVDSKKAIKNLESELRKHPDIFLFDCLDEFYK